MKRFVALAALFALTAAAFGVYPQTSNAQYPPPEGSVTATTSSTSADTGENVILTCLLLDTSGEPIVGEDCTFNIEDEPGDDAAVGSKVITKTTNAQGIATTNLYTGTAPGVIVVSITAGEMSSTVVVQVMGATSSPPAAPVEDTISPPSTGDAGLASN
jgi:hypothetical protein